MIEQLITWALGLLAGAIGWWGLGRYRAGKRAEADAEALRSEQLRVGRVVFEHDVVEPMRAAVEPERAAIHAETVGTVARIRAADTLEDLEDEVAALERAAEDDEP